MSIFNNPIPEIPGNPNNPNLGNNNLTPSEFKVDIRNVGAGTFQIWYKYNEVFQGYQSGLFADLKEVQIIFQDINITDATDPQLSGNASIMSSPDWVVYGNTIKRTVDLTADNIQALGANEGWQRFADITFEGLPNAADLVRIVVDSISAKRITDSDIGGYPNTVEDATVGVENTIYPADGNSFPIPPDTNITASRNISGITTPGGNTGTRWTVVGANLGYSIRHVDLEVLLDGQTYVANLNGDTYNTTESTDQNTYTTWSASFPDLDFVLNGDYEVRYVGKSTSGSVLETKVVATFTLDAADTSHGQTPNTPPSITLNGDNPAYVSQGSDYTDAGITVTDPDSGDVLSWGYAHDSETVDTSTTGSYTIRYWATDDKEPVNAERTVIVRDDTAPYIVLIGANPITLPYGSDWAAEDPGYTANDANDGNITGLVSVSGSVDGTTAGTYTITYDVTDQAGNAAPTATRTVVIESQPDTNAPVITLTGPNPQPLAYGVQWIDPGYSASDDTDGDLTAYVARTGTVNEYSAGDYTITYTISDSAGNSASATRVVQVQEQPDTNPPVITLVGGSTVTLAHGEGWADPGYSAADAEDGDLTDQVSLGGDYVDYDTAGTYHITYTVSDSAGNEGTASRTVIVSQPVVPPTITLVGGSTVEHLSGTPYYDLGATATNSFGAEINSLVQSDASVFSTNYTSTTGTYTITYTVQDPNTGLTASTQRTVNVHSAPVITLNGDMMMHVELHGAAWSDPGATAVDDGVDVTADIVVDDQVDDTTVGTYSVTYTITDKDDPAVTVSVTRTVMVEVKHCPEVEDLDLADGAPNLSGLTVASNNQVNYNGQAIDVSGYTSGQWASLASNVGLSADHIATSKIEVGEVSIAGGDGQTTVVSRLDPSLWEAYPFGPGKGFNLTKYVTDTPLSPGIGVNQDGSSPVVQETVIKFLTYMDQRLPSTKDSFARFQELSSPLVRYPFDWHCALESQFSGQDVVIMASDKFGIVDLAKDTNYPKGFIEFRLVELVNRGQLSQDRFQLKYYGTSAHGLVDEKGEKIPPAKVAVKSPTRKTITDATTLKSVDVAPLTQPPKEASVPTRPSATTYEVWDRLHNRGITRKPKYPELPSNPAFLLKGTKKAISIALDKYIQPAQATPLYLGTLYASELAGYNRAGVLQVISDKATELGVDISSYIPGT